MALVVLVCVQELLVYLSEQEDFDASRDHANLVWSEDLVYGDWTGGPHGDGSRSSAVDVSVPEVEWEEWLPPDHHLTTPPPPSPPSQSVQRNGTWYLHVLLVKAGFPLDPEDEDHRHEAVVHKIKCEPPPLPLSPLIPYMCDCP